jgi:hypothetical protein
MEVLPMPFMKNGKRDYKREVALYTSKPEVVKKRTEQNAARRKMEQAGKVHKGDGKDVDHKTPLSKGGGNSTSNLRVVDRSSNRSFSRNANGSLKSQTSKREAKRRK